MNIYISLIITMLFSAFFSGMEIAFVSVDKLRFEMERKGGITSRILSIFFKNPNEFISTMLVGNNIALVIYGILMAQIIGENLLAGFIDNHFLMVLAQTHFYPDYFGDRRVPAENIVQDQSQYGIERFRRSTFYLLRCFISYIQVVFRFVLHLPAHFRHEGKQGCVRQSFRKGGS
jgi:hypothetical protein